MLLRGTFGLLFALGVQVEGNARVRMSHQLLHQGKLLECLPVDRIGRTQLVQREDLQAFLEGARAAPDVAAYCAAQRTQRSVKTRRKLRGMSLTELDTVPPDSLRPWLSPGLLSVPFYSLDELSDGLWRIAISLRDSLGEFSRLDEPSSTREESIELSAAQEDLRRM